MEIKVGTAAVLGPMLMRSLMRYRHWVFVEKLGWDLAAHDGLERDQFDHDETLYVVAVDPHGRVAGCARLLPTTRSYLLQEVFPQLMHGAPLPCTDDVWELSRFAAVDPDVGTGPAAGQLCSATTLLVLAAAARAATERGARRLITVSPQAVGRLLRSTGAAWRPAGRLMQVGSHRLFACWIDTDSVAWPAAHPVAARAIAADVLPAPKLFTRTARAHRVPNPYRWREHHA